VFSSKARSFLIRIILLLCTSSCATQVATPEPVYLRIAGSSSMVPVLKTLAATYTEQHPEVTIDIQKGGTQAGLQSLREGRIDLAAASWQDDVGKNDPAITDTPESSSLEWYAIASDGVAIVVHPDNTLENLSLEGASELFAGWQVDWIEVAGKGGEIEVISREDGSGTRMAFEDLVMGDRTMTQTAIVMPSSQAVIDWIGTHSNAIGYASMALITDTVQALQINDVALSVRNVEQGRYPLTRELYLVAQKPADRAVQNFIDFCRSPAGQSIVSDYHAKAK